MSFDKRMIATCDWCKVNQHDTGKKDTEGANKSLKSQGWECFKIDKRTSGHICTECNN